MSNYIHTPKTISYNDIVECDFSLSSSQHKKFEIANQNCKLVKEFLTRALSRKDLGVEVGSANYIGQSSHYFCVPKHYKTILTCLKLRLKQHCQSYQAALLR